MDIFVNGANLKKQFLVKMYIQLYSDLTYSKIVAQALAN